MKHLRFAICDLRFAPRKWHVALLFIGIYLAAPFFPAPAADAQQAAERPGRYLIVVDTSFLMRRSAQNIQMAVGQLLLSDMNGQLRAGDTIGLWTFNENLQAGQFPLQYWTPETRQTVATNVADFLGRQSYEKQSRPDVMLPEMFQLIRSSERITVLLVTGGDAKIGGTPFDPAVNQVFEAGRAYMRKLRQPFITILRARRGTFTGCSINWSPWPVEFPPFPVEPRPIETPAMEAKPDSTQSSELKPRPAVPPLIIIGKKPEPAAPTTHREEKAEVSSAAVVSPANEPAAAPATPTNETPALVPQIATTPAPQPERVEQAQKPAPPEPIIPEVVVERPKAEIPAEPPPKPVQPVEKPEVTAPASAQSQTPPAQTAVATTPVAQSSRTIFLLAGLAALLAALGLVFMLLRRSRSVSSTSLITRSMDREKK